MDCTAYRPMPGQVNTLSTIGAPPSSAATPGPTTVTNGGSAFGGSSPPQPQAGWRRGPQHLEVGGTARLEDGSAQHP